MLNRNTIWRNLKTQTLYRIWMMASEINLMDLVPYVIYQDASVPIPQFELFPVQDTEHEDRIGNVFNTPIAPEEWCLHWEQNLKSKPIAWARPYSMWSEKFEQVNEP